jgi:hypothetical protein
MATPLSGCIKEQESDPLFAVRRGIRGHNRSTLFSTIQEEYFTAKECHESIELFKNVGTNVKHEEEPVTVHNHK